MKADERENNLYSAGKRCQISEPEKILLEYLEKYAKPRSRVLDIGCGSGEITRKIKEKKYIATGLDFSSKAVELAKKFGLDCKLCDLDTGIPFDSDSFDVVWAGDIIEHVFDPIYVLKEVNRVLVDRGNFFFTIPYDLKLTTRLRILFGHSYQEGVYKKFHQYKHHTFFSIPLLKYMLKNSALYPKEIKFVIKFPKIGKKFISKNRAVIYFAETLAVRSLSIKK